MSKKTLLSTVTALGLLVGASMAHACGTTAWAGGTSATGVAAGGPGEALNIGRYSGFCAMQATDGHVQDNSPANETRMITQVYALFTGTGSADIYTTFSDEPAIDAAGTPVYTVSYDGSTGMLTFDAGAGTTTAAVNVGWNSITMDWNSSGIMNIWVNEDATTALAPTTTVATAAGTISSARLGADNVVGDLTARFDDYEARRTTLIARKIPGDANGDNTLSLADAVLILNEFLTGTLNSGSPDANESGEITLADAVIALNRFLTGG